MYAAVVPFDTHKYVKDFVSVGMSELQAEAVVRIVSESKSYDLSKLSTKEQVILLDHKLDTSVAMLDQKIDTSVAMLEHKIDALEDKLDASVAMLDQKIDASVAMLEQKIDTL